MAAVCAQRIEVSTRETQGSAWAQAQATGLRDIEPGKNLAIVRVTRGFDVHSLWHNNRNTYFIRVGTQGREPSPEELGRLFQQRGSFRAELRPVSGATLSSAKRNRTSIRRRRENPF